MQPIATRRNKSNDDQRIRKRKLLIIFLSLSFDERSFLAFYFLCENSAEFVMLVLCALVFSVSILR